MRRVIAFAVFLFVAGTSGVASAHVSITPSSVEAGTVVDLVFRVPNERTDASTNRVEIVFPTDPAFTTAQTSAPAGWSQSTDQSEGYVSSVIFSEGSISGAESANFTVTVTAPRTVPKVQFRVIQTYSSGEVVRWIDMQAPESEGTGHGAGTSTNPAPSVTVNGFETTTTTVPPTTVPPTTVAPDAADDDSSSSGIGRVFIAIGVVAIVFVMLRSRRRMSA